MSKQLFVANTILTAAQLNTLQTNDFNQTVSTKTASYTLVATDAGTKIVMNSASATTITVNTSLFAAGDNLTIANISTGVCTVTAGTATVSSAGPLAVPQFGGGTLYFTSAGVSIFSPTAVTVAAPAAAGLTLISATTITGASVNILNCFSATYRNYLIIGDSVTGASAGFGFHGKFGVSGTPTTGNYDSSLYGDTSAVVDFINLATFTANQGFILNCYAPNAAIKTMYTHMSVNNGGTGRQISGYQTDATAYTDFQILMQGGSTSFTGGTVRIYGYANS